MACADCFAAPGPRVSAGDKQLAGLQHGDEEGVAADAHYAHCPTGRRNGYRYASQQRICPQRASAHKPIEGLFHGTHTQR
jgi:hypothetical protein